MSSKPIAIQVQNPKDESEYVEAKPHMEHCLAPGVKFRRVYVNDKGQHCYGPLLTKE